MAVHQVFQRLATFEINNAATVRSVLNSARIVFWIGSILGAVGLAVPIATGFSGFRRRSDFEEKDDEQHFPEYWNHVDHMAQSVMAAIHKGDIKYQL